MITAIRHSVARLLISALLGISEASIEAAAQFGAVVAWGENSFGQASVPSGLTDVVAISAGHSHASALRRDGTVVAWGWNFMGVSTVPAGLSNVTAVSGGGLHTIALKSDGNIVGWGSDIWGQATAPRSVSRAVAIAAGYSYSLALREDGTVIGWGDNSYGQISMPSGLSNVVAIAAGHLHNLALKADGTVVSWGRNEAGERNVPPGLSNVIAVAAGGNHSLALKRDHTVVQWGGFPWEFIGTPPENLTNAIAIAAGGRYSLALTSDAHVVGWGAVNVPEGIRKVFAISASIDGYNLVLSIPNTPPVAIAQAASVSLLSSNKTNFIVLALNNSNVAVILDGLHSYDLDDDPLEYAWTSAAGSAPFAVTGRTTNSFEVGAYAVTLSVSDGRESGIAVLNLEVITPCDVLQGVLLQIAEASIPRNVQHSLSTILEASCRAFDEGRHTSAVNQLEAFVNKVGAQVASKNPMLAEELTAIVQKMIGALGE